MPGKVLKGPQPEPKPVPNVKKSKLAPRKHRLLRVMKAVKTSGGVLLTVAFFEGKEKVAVRDKQASDSILSGRAGVMAGEALDKILDSMADDYDKELNASKIVGHERFT
jgi:hypothetical protein